MRLVWSALADSGSGTGEVSSIGFERSFEVVAPWCASLSEVGPDLGWIVVGQRFAQKLVMRHCLERWLCRCTCLDGCRQKVHSDLRYSSPPISMTSPSPHS
jgi:hypothetical protein